MNLPFNLGSIHRLPVHNLDVEIQTCQQQIASAPEDAALHVQFAAWLYTANRLDEALPEYGEGIRLLKAQLSEPPNPSDLSLLALASYQIGCVLNALHRSTEARPHLQQAVTLYESIYPNKWPLNTHAKRARKELGHTYVV